MRKMIKLQVGTDDVHKVDERLDVLPLKAAKLIEKKHQQIVEGARRILIEKGYHPTTIREIAQECGMSMGQLYHYIASKDDVLYLVFQDMYNIWHEHMKYSGIEREKDPVERLRKALYHSLLFTATNKRLIQFIFTESKYLGAQHLRAVLKMDFDNLLDFWRNMVAAIPGFETKTETLTFAASLIEYIIMYIPLRGWTVADRPLEDNFNYLIDFVFRGIGITTN
jgi:AcrR family transcriptional regulator